MDHGVKTRRQVHPLEQLRLDHFWSYRTLAKLITNETGLRRDQDSWRKICQGITDEPDETTRHGMETFLAGYPKYFRMLPKPRKTRKPG
jgi:hypothetical protein